MEGRCPCRLHELIIMDPTTRALFFAAANSGPPATYLGSYLFTNAGRDYSTSASNWTVPANTTHIWVKMWGAGGANDSFPNSFDGSDGGGGGFSSGLITVTPGETIKVAVGDLDINGGGGNILGTAQSGKGGGFSGIFRASTPLIMAGGGGGGGYNTSAAAGGAGGGLSGQNSVINPGSTGGTQSAGGSPGGAYLTGGSSGGGGGYYGGGSGSGTSYGGSGGSGYIGGATFGTTVQGNGRIPGMSTGDPDGPTTFGYGGTGSNNNVYNMTRGRIMLHCWQGNPNNQPNPPSRVIITTY